MQDGGMEFADAMQFNVKVIFLTQNRLNWIPAFHYCPTVGGSLFQFYFFGGERSRGKQILKQQTYCLGNAISLL